MLDALRGGRVGQLLPLPGRRRPAGRLPRDGGLRGRGVRRWRRRTSTRAGRRRWRSSSSCASGPTPACAPGGGVPPCLSAPVRRGRSRGDERPRVRRARSRAAASSSRRCTASRTGRWRCPDGLRWDLAAPVHGGAGGDARARPRSPASGSTPGASTTRCSTSSGRVLGLPFHYRDARRRDDRARLRPVAGGRAVRGRPASRRCRSTPSSSCSRTRTPRRCDAAPRIALVPDLLAYWLSGELVNERTNASTTGLLDARTGSGRAG